MMYDIFFFQAEDGIRDGHVTGVQTCALPISASGMAAILSTFMALLQAGDHVVCSRSVFGTTTVLLNKFMQKFGVDATRSEEHTSELQSRGHLVCRLLLERNKTRTDTEHIPSN